MSQVSQDRMIAPRVGSWGNWVSAALVALIGLAYAHMNVTVVVPAFANALESEDVAGVVSPSLVAWELGWLLAILMGWLLSRYLPFVSTKARYELARKVIKKYDIAGDDVRLAVASSSLLLPRRSPQGVDAQELKRSWVLAYRYDTRLDWLTGEKARIIILVVGRKREVFVWVRDSGGSYTEPQLSRPSPR